ncbi:hypothetical protein ESCO_000008 [Escovopsis weberi]|uniref:Late sexual development protein n=1 Tax=Escovopsis weberi TaxID=150374 RepID=A0A0M8MVN7_ESCWE|nr:hypothetical protein ESCO_000008 [Escovopsis weberi]
MAARLLRFLAPALALASLASADTSKSQLPNNGFPNLEPSQLLEIEIKADGVLPTSPPPPRLSNSTLQTFQVIAINEQWEVAFFNTLLNNILNNEPGYESWDDEAQKAREKIVQVILKQEELHALNARGILQNFKAFVPDPCRYNFPPGDIRSAFKFAQTFTALVVGALGDASQGAAANGDIQVPRALSSVIGEESEQQGYYRTVLGQVPTEKPFVTFGLGIYLFSWLNNVATIPDSCSYDVYGLGIPIIPQLYADGSATGLDVEPKNQTIKFSADLSKAPAAKPYIGHGGTGLYVTYLNGAQKPVSLPIVNVHWHGEEIVFEAFFPFEEYIMFGHTFAALTIGNDFNVLTDANKLIENTLAAPAFINVYDFF